MSSPYSYANNGLFPSGLQQGQLPSFNVAQAISSLSSTANTLASSSASSAAIPIPGSSFRAPAHKHAHHLHSIPPREKSTRTLILDHMLWVHGRTRFAQARAELGMTDRTGGPSSENYAHRQRPENFEEEEEVQSDGEDFFALHGRAGAPGPLRNDDEEERASKQDLTLARGLRLRAEGVEKVVTSMLDQPPPWHPINDDDFLDPPTSPSLKPHADSSHPHTLPNGVRLRLALGTLLNDLFARQAPLPPYRDQHHPSNSSDTQSLGPTPVDTPVLARSSAPFAEPFVPAMSLSSLPPALMSLSLVSAGWSTGTRSLSAVSEQHPLKSPTAASPRLPNFVQQKSIPAPSPRAREMYNSGADPDLSSAPPGYRCPRHLFTGCEICVEAKSGGRPGAETRKVSNSGGNIDGHNRTSSKNGGGITGWQEGSGIGSGLARPGIGGTVLRRRSASTSDQMKTAGNTKLSELIPRFIRLSALVACELGSEARDEESERARDGAASPERIWEREEDERMQRSNLSSSPSSIRTVNSATLARHRLYANALRPSREWFMLLAGLLTRAVLEGYLTARWRGLEPVECLLMVGQGILDTANSPDKGREKDAGIGDSGNVDEDSEDEFAWFDPDEHPSLQDAIRILFPALRNPRSAPLYKKDDAYAEFEMEMDERLRKFYDIPASTPDLSTHMEDLAWQYPAEPIERAAVRFCEAIAKWRGKPELETYKKKPPGHGNMSEVTDSSSMTIESLVHSNPTSPTAATFNTTKAPPRPPIEKYFVPLHSLRDNLNKRM